MNYYNGAFRYTENELCKRILDLMSIPNFDGYDIDTDELVYSVIGDCTEEELRPYGAKGYAQLYADMLWAMIYEWFDSNNISFDSHYYAYIDGWNADDDDDYDDDDDDDDDDDGSQMAMSLVEDEDWDSLANEVWEDFCNGDFKKYGIDADDYKLAKDEEEEDY